MENHILPLLKKIKNFFLTHPELSENIVNALGKSLRNTKSIN